MAQLLVGYLIALAGWVASFYLWGQWLVYPKMRRRFRVCKPFVALGWVLWTLGSSVLAPYGQEQGSAGLRALGGLMGIVGVGLVVYASIRLLRANAAERRAARQGSVIQMPEGTWPPPPQVP